MRIEFVEIQNFRKLKSIRIDFSDKTTLLVGANNSGKRMRLRGQRIAVITYTNAACDEIKRRLNFDPLVSVSTIHSFVWELIKGFNADIRQWLQNNLAADIGELKELLHKGKAGTKTAMERGRSIEAKQKRLAALPTIKRFVYSPTGDNRGRDALNHSEVIKIGGEFLAGKALMQSLLTNRFPIMLVDESQDANKLLMDSLLAVQAAHGDRFGIGLFGDMMQRIYSDGKIDLDRNLPTDWAKPAKKMNHRCPRRVVRLINKIRSPVDAQEQQARAGAIEGYVRLFVAASGAVNKFQIEAQAKAKMAEVTSDSHWNHPELVKTLILEHHMAAKRFNFFEMFEPLYQIDEFRTGLLDGTLPILRVFSDLVLPLIRAKQGADEFGVATIVRRSSPLLSRGSLLAAGADQRGQLRAAQGAVQALMTLWAGGAQPRFIEVLRCIALSRLFEIPETLMAFASADVVENDAAPQTADASIAGEGSADVLGAVRAFLNTPFAQIEPYVEYIRGEAAFDTHQGVKGLEFSRVLVVMDDEDARGFLFSYEKLFGAKDKTKSDLDNERAGNDSGIDRTRRLFYVTCSRSQESLAIVAYSSSPAKIKAHAIDQGWFDPGEIELLA